MTTSQDASLSPLGRAQGNASVVGGYGFLPSFTCVRYIGGEGACASRWLKHGEIYMVRACEWDESVEELRLRFYGVDGAAFLRSLFEGE